jgi:hypothetical protein
MRHLSLILTLLVIVVPHPLMAEWWSEPRLQMNDTSNPSIESPVTGQAVQGSTAIRGSTGIERFQSYEVNFTYEGNPALTWFLIQEGTAPIQDGVLAEWDTTTITDGDYILRLLVTLNDGTQVEAIVNDIRVRNYSPIETETPTPIPPLVTLVPGISGGLATPSYTPARTLTPLPMPPTPLPTNPAVITSSQKAQTLGTGAAISIGMLALLGAYLGLHTLFHKYR